MLLPPPPFPLPLPCPSAPYPTSLCKHTHMPHYGRKGQRDLERQIRDNTRLEKVAQKQIREAAKRNDMASAKVLAKELVHTRRMTSRLWTNKAHMMSMNSQLTEQLGMVKVAGTLSKSTQVWLHHCMRIAVHFQGYLQPNATKLAQINR